MPDLRGFCISILLKRIIVAIIQNHMCPWKNNESFKDYFILFQNSSSWLINPIIQMRIKQITQATQHGKRSPSF